jgi:cellulose synthase/poly-beta-1,6-N-acetylglucosamine synthase-like glycosyltransferase
MPIVSVIVPAYNSAAFVGDAIDSLLAQTLHDIEIIVIDDGSNDATYAIAESRARSDARVTVIRREQSGGGPARARNAGLSIASGDYVALLDADDLALPHRLATTVAAMRSAHAEIGFADMVRLDMATGVQEDTGILAQREFLRAAASYLVSTESGAFCCRPDFLGFMLAHHWVVSVPTIVWTRALLEQETVWFDETLKCAEDLDLFLRLAARGRMVFVDETVTLHRKHPDSLTTTAPLVTIVDGAKVRERYLATLLDRIRPSDVVAARAFIAHAFWEAGYASWLAGRPSQARSHFKRSFRMRRSRTAVLGYLKALFPRDALIALLRRADR